MFKKLVLATAVLATSSTIAFAAATSAPYIGASMGIVDNTASNGNIFRGMPVNLFAGYGAIVNQNIYLGGELFGTLGTFSLSHNNTAIGSSGLKSTYGYGASFMPGIVLNDRAMMFARIGAVGTRFSSKGSTVAGGQFGLGLQTNIMQHWDLRGEYDYTLYHSFQSSTPRSDAFNLGVVYKID